MESWEMVHHSVLFIAGTSECRTVCVLGGLLGWGECSPSALVSLGGCLGGAFSAGRRNEVLSLRTTDSATLDLCKACTALLLHAMRLASVPVCGLQTVSRQAQPGPGCAAEEPQ